MRLIFGITAILLSIAGAACAPPSGRADATVAPAYGKVTSQSYDQKLGLSEIHLANGLTILAKESHAAPVVFFSVWYRVGSRNEISGQTGLSHILEHMMFKGTAQLPPGAIEHIFLANGAQLNATTSFDRTEYHELISSNDLAIAARIEADRMVNSAFDPDELRHEMSVVRSELEGRDNDPIHDLETTTFVPAAFTQHPYHWPVIGWRDDVEAVANRRDVIYRYYKQHYAPNNAYVVAVGDFQTSRLISICQKYFGVYPAAPIEEHHISPEPPQRGERRVVLNRPGTSPCVMIGYHASAAADPDTVDLNILQRILTGGRGSRLYRDLVDAGLAFRVDADAPRMKDPGLFEIDAGVRPDSDCATVEKAIEAELDKLKTDPPTVEEVNRAIRQVETGMVYSRDSVSDQGRLIGEAEAAGGYRRLDDIVERTRAVTPADIVRVANRYFSADNRTVAYFEPTALPAGAAPPSPAAGAEKNFGAPAPITDPAQNRRIEQLTREYSALSTAPSTLRRSKPTRVVLDNGLVLIVQENHANPSVSVSGRLIAGSMLEPQGKWGVAAVTAAMLPQGTTTRSARQLSLALESRGAGVSIGANDQSVGLSAQCLAEDFSTTIGVLADELQHPLLSADDLEKVRWRALARLQQARQDTGGAAGPGVRAEIAFSQAIYPKGYPLWIPALDDQESSLRQLSIDDIRAFYGAYYRPDTTVLTVVGDVDTADVVKTVKDAFGDWSKPSSQPPTLSIADPPAQDNPQAPQAIVLPGAPQTTVLWGYSGRLHRSDKDFYAAQVLNYILGGSVFDSRLGRTIRDRNGLAYSVSGAVEASHNAGPVRVFLGTNPANAARALALLREVIDDLATHGVTQQEVDQAKRYLTGSFPLRLETNGQVAAQLLSAEDYGLGMDFLEKRNALIQAVTLADVDAAARKHLDVRKATYLVVGAQMASQTSQR